MLERFGREENRRIAPEPRFARAALEAPRPGGNQTVPGAAKKNRAVFIRASVEQRV